MSEQAAVPQPKASLSLPVAVLISGLCIAVVLWTGLLFMGQHLTARYELRQGSSAFVRFDRFSGELCFATPYPDPDSQEIAFLTEEWICMAGDQKSEAKYISPEKLQETLQKVGQT